MRFSYRIVLAGTVLVGCSTMLGLDDKTYDLVPDAAAGASATAGVGGRAGEGGHPDSGSGGARAGEGGQRDSGSSGAGAGGAGQSGAGGTGGTRVEAGTPEAFSDEFDDERTLASWTVRDQAEMTAADHSLVEVDGGGSGRLVIEPTLGPHWSDGRRGPFIFKDWTGDFRVTVRVFAYDRAGGTSPPPAGAWAGVGILVRDGTTVATSENWVLVTNGLLGSASATGMSYWRTTASATTFIATVPGPHHAYLSLCRFGGTLRLYRRLEGDQEWVLHTVLFEGSTAPSLPSTVQLGIAAHLFDASSPNLRAEVEFIRLTVPVIEAHCAPVD